MTISEFYKEIDTDDVDRLNEIFVEIDGYKYPVDSVTIPNDCEIILHLGDNKEKMTGY